MNAFSFTITNLLSVLTGHRGLQRLSNKKIKIETKFINIEKGFHVAYIKLNAFEEHKFIQKSCSNKDWNIVCLSDKQLCFNDSQYSPGVFVGFGNKNYSLTIGANQEVNLFFLLISKSYLHQYQYSDCFRRIKKSRKEIYHIALSKLNLPEFTPEKTMGLVKTKSFSIYLLTTLRVEAEKLRINLKHQIKNYCSECLKNNQNIVDYLAQKLRIEPRHTVSLFKDTFKQDINNYYDDFKINNAKNFIRTNKEQLDKIILECLKGPCPVAILLGHQFEISEKKYKQLFFEETGEHISKYCKRLRLNVARQLLSNGLKTQKVANMSGFPNPLTLRRFFQRNEGISPQQFRTEVSKVNLY